jgi:hypothetical protein
MGKIGIESLEHRVTTFFIESSHLLEVRRKVTATQVERQSALHER